MKRLFILLILIGIVPIAHSIQQPPSRLYFINQAVSWSAAQSYCRTHYTDLARVNDNSVLQTLKAVAASRGLSAYPLWIGLYNDVTSWRWSLSNRLLSNTPLTNWEAGQPDNLKGVESCGTVLGSGFWEDSDCSLLLPFICYSAGNSGADRFVGVSSFQMNWTDAQTYCRTFHTDLASSLDQTDNDLFAQVAAVQGPSWFGLFRDAWKWLNRTVATDIPWKPGQPDIHFPLKTCGALQNGQFMNDFCSSKHFFFCELCPPVWMKIIKLQVTSDGSVFDPAVQLSILNQLSQKLDKYGKFNASVTWRVQTGGNIFYKKNKDIL